MVIVISPEHMRTFREAGWSKAKFKEELRLHATIPADSILAGADGITGGAPEKLKGKMLTKVRDGGIQVVHAGGQAGMFSAILPGWTGGLDNSRFVTKVVGE